MLICRPRRYAPRARFFIRLAGAYAPAYIISPHKGAIKFGEHSPAGYPLQITIYRVFRDAQCGNSPLHPCRRSPAMGVESFI